MKAKPTTQKDHSRRRVQKRTSVERATYTVDELAALLGRNRIGIYSDLASGAIPSRRLGNRYIISRAAVHKWLDGTDAEDAA